MTPTAFPPRWFFAAFLLLAATPAARAEGDKAAFFDEKIRPLLVQNCFKCHSHEAKKNKGGLVLDARAAILAGGESGQAVVPGKPDASLLIKAVRHTDDKLQMPPGKQLSSAQVADLERWVRDGAVWSTTEATPVR